ncbi:MAG: stage II sporulation protein M [Candidatus Promineifilaceae bacterium]
MKVEKFYESRQSDWKKLSVLLHKAQPGIQRLSPEEVDQLGRLYRAVTSDLALAQRDFPQHKVTIYLNQLVGRSHATIYRHEPLALRRLIHFITTGFPQTYRSIWPFILTAALLFIIPAVLSAVIVGHDPNSAEWLLPAQVQELIPVVEDRELWIDIPIEERPYTSTVIMQNNIQVSFIAFGSGVLAGLVTIWILITNGLILGGLTGLTAYYGIGFELWSFVIGHGVVELSVIFIAGGAGLSLGWAIISPGLYRRRDALALAARKSIYLILGCVPLLVIAGTIEGFISPNESIPWPAKWSVGIITGLLLYTYLIFAGRFSPDTRLKFRLTNPLQAVSITKKSPT